MVVSLPPWRPQEDLQIADKTPILAPLQKIVKGFSEICARNSLTASDPAAK
jgi:hypothetical protein